VIARRYPISRASYQGVSRVPSVVGPIHVVGPYAATGPDAHTQPGESPHLQARSPRSRTRLRRAHRSRSRRACLPPADHQGRLDGLMPFYDAGHEGAGGFNTGIEHLVTAVLVSPDFLYRGIALPRKERNSIR